MSAMHGERDVEKNHLYDEDNDASVYEQAHGMPEGKGHG